MISAFNNRQILRAILAVLLGVVATAVTIAFFYGGPKVVLERMELQHLSVWIPYLAAIALVIVFYTGWDRWRRGVGQPELSESVFSYSFDNSVGGGMRANIAIIEERVYGYVFSQIALAAPLQILKAYDLIRSRISDDPRLESSLRELLHTIESKDRWHSIKDYRSREREIMYLVRMEKIDFSPRKGSLRPKN